MVYAWYILYSIYIFMSPSSGGVDGASCMSSKKPKMKAECEWDCNWKRAREK